MSGTTLLTILGTATDKDLGEAIAVARSIDAHLAVVAMAVAFRRGEVAVLVVVVLDRTRWRLLRFDGVLCRRENGFPQHPGPLPARLEPNDCIGDCIDAEAGRRGQSNDSIRRRRDSRERARR